MLRLARFIKPFIGSIVLALILLFGQALCDLNLPNLMSDIVNVGIQQGGVEDRSPVALSADGYELVEAFLAEDERALLDANYTKVSPGDDSGNGAPYRQEYPDASAEGFYVINPQVPSETRAQLDEAFGLATWTMVGVLRDFGEGGAEAVGIDPKVLAAAQQGAGAAEAAGAAQSAAQQDAAAQSAAAAAASQGAGSGTAAAAQQNAPAAPQESGSGTTPPQQNAGAATQNAGSATQQNADAAATEPQNTGADLSADIQDMDFTQVYKALPLIKLIPASNMASYQQAAANTDQMLRDESATMLARNFYKELGVDMGSYELGYILRIGLIMLVITLAGGACTVLVSLFSSRAGAGVARDLRSAIYNKVMSFSHTEFDRFSTASLITRSTNDVTQIQMLVSMGIRMLCYAPIMGAGAFIMAIQKSVNMSWIIGLAVLFLVCVMGVLVAVVMPKFRIIQKLIDRLNLVARETLNGQMVIRAFSRTAFEQERFERANDDVTKTNLFIQRAMVFMMPILMVFMNGLTVLIIWVGADQVAASQMQVGDMMAYMQYAMMMVMSFMFIAMAFIFVPRAAVSAGRIADVLETKPVIVDAANPHTLPPTAELAPELRGRVELKDVSFCFEGAEAHALQHVSLVAEPGTTTALIGSTGSGKSSVLNLIPRFYDATEGTVLFDGVDVRELAITDLRGRIGFVPQKSLLMSGTIAENIAYGRPDLSSEDIKKAAEVAQALDFIGKLELPAEDDAPPEGDELNSSDTPAVDSEMPLCDPQNDEKANPDPGELAPGFDFEIAQGGGNISGGQRQRLAIARALAIKPEVFLFDDSFSALDFATDAALRKALAATTNGATLIIVAQRVGTIMNADRIYVLDNGAVIGEGTHAQLLASCEAYREIAESQLSPEELAGGAA